MCVYIYSYSDPNSECNLFVSYFFQLLSARDMAQRTFIGKDRIVYSTEKDMYEQDFDTQEWDRRFKEMERSE